MLEALAFQVPITGPVPGAPVQGEARLILSQAGGKATALAIEIRPSQAAFMARLPRLLAESGFAGDVFALGRAGSVNQPVLTYSAGPATLARVPVGLTTLAALEAFLRPGPAILDLTDYSLTAIAFEAGDVAR
ncbi:MAG: hypothetical protein JWM80_1527 [Cyanobacteria bacterium RYN_339]|nr:hypothetical protein [Cyanobacteria bacterium RYN_339]